MFLSLLELDVEKEELITRLLKRGQETGRSDDNLEGNPETVS